MMSTVRSIRIGLTSFAVTVIAILGHHWAVGGAFIA